MLEAARSGEVDAALLAFDLHRLTRDRLSELRRRRVPLVLLTPYPDGDDASGDHPGGPAVPGGPGVEGAGAGGLEAVSPVHLVQLDAVPDEVLDALLLAVHQAPAPLAPRLAPPRRRPLEGGGATVVAPRPGAARTSRTPPPGGPGREEQRRAAPTQRPAEGPAGNQPGALALTTIAVVGGPGSPGCTTVAINLAAALGAVAPTVCVDASRTPSVAAYLDADPLKSLYMLAHADPQTAREWEQALTQELQPLHRRSTQGAILAGVPKPEMWGGVRGDFTVRLLAELRQRFRYVVLDVGHRPPDADPGLWGASVQGADQVLFVTATDLVGTWRAQTALGALGQERPLRRPDGGAAVALVLNRHDRRHHHTRAEIEWALNLAAGAVVPFDHGATERAIAAQRPLVLDDRSRAGRALVALAERVHSGRVVLPPEEDAEEGGRFGARVGTIGTATLAWWTAGQRRLTAGASAVAARLRTRAGRAGEGLGPGGGGPRGRTGPRRRRPPPPVRTEGGAPAAEDITAAAPAAAPAAAGAAADPGAVVAGAGAGGPAGGLVAGWPEPRAGRNGSAPRGPARGALAPAQELHGLRTGGPVRGRPRGGRRPAPGRAPGVPYRPRGRARAAPGRPPGGEPPAGRAAPAAPPSGG